METVNNHVIKPQESPNLNTLKNTMKFLKKNPEISKLMCKTQFTGEQLMLLLDSYKLEALEEEWAKQEEGISMVQFVWLMQCAIPHNPLDKFELYSGLIRLFNDVDINGDRNLEWFEFTQYMTEAVITQKKLNLIEDEEAAAGRFEFRQMINLFILQNLIK